MVQGPAEVGQKEIRTDWPVEEGVIVETTSQIGRTINLVFQEGSNVLSRNKALI